MLRQKLLIGSNLNLQPSHEACSTSTECRDSQEHEHNHDHSTSQPQDTLSPQCEHIVVKAVYSWGGADVTVKDLEATIIDVLEQMTSDKIESGSSNSEIQARCADLQREIEEVIAEIDAPKVSDQVCDDKK